jgi:hypothetical protein
MGIDLRGEGDRYFGCSATLWEVYRGVAEAFGWRPAGTVAPEGHVGSWPGHYGGNACQRVTAADAAALADALGRAVGSAEFEGVLFRVWGMDPDEDVRRLLPEWERPRVVELIEFCRGGGFRIL